jgi:hypothetical protein
MELLIQIIAGFLFSSSELSSASPFTADARVRSQTSKFGIFWVDKLALG